VCGQPVPLFEQPTTRCPAAFLSLLDACLRLDGCVIICKLLFGTHPSSSGHGMYVKERISIIRCGMMLQLIATSYSGPQAAEESTQRLTKRGPLTERLKCVNQVEAPYRVYVVHACPDFQTSSIDSIGYGTLDVRRSCLRSASAVSVGGLSHGNRYTQCVTQQCKYSFFKEGGLPEPRTISCIVVTHHDCCVTGRLVTA
jgi:hypothetical protein